MLFFEPYEINKAACSVRFIAKDGEEIHGTCDLLIHDDVADLVSLTLCDQDLSVGEGLFRAALHYAANRGVYMACCSAPTADAVRSRMSFHFMNGRWINDIPSLLMGSCVNH